MNYDGGAANPINLPEYRGALDFKVYSPDRPFKRFYRVGAWSTRNDISWRLTVDALNDVWSWGNADCFTCL